MLKNTKRTAVAITLITTALLGGTSVAHADATGASTWNKITIKGIPIPGGTLKHTIIGKKTKIYVVDASFVTVPKLCEWWINYDFFDAKDGQRYHHIEGNRQGCTTNGKSRFNVGNIQFRRGKACATLFAMVPGGPKILTQQCHNLQD